jgi:tRNA(adenine34) deaminase
MYVFFDCWSSESNLVFHNVFGRLKEGWRDTFYLLILHLIALDARVLKFETRAFFRPCIQPFRASAKIRKMLEIDEKWMREALRQAGLAKECGEVPVGACLVDANGKLAAVGFNQTITASDPTAHAEILALRGAALAAGNYRLVGMTMYTTVEPCAMCAGALVNARIARLVFGTRDERFGAVESKFRLCDSDVLNHRIDIVSGVLAEECRKLMQDFFKERRTREPA